MYGAFPLNCALQIQTRLKMTRKLSFESSLATRGARLSPLTCRPHPPSGVVPLAMGLLVFDSVRVDRDPACVHRRHKPELDRRCRDLVGDSLINENDHNSAGRAIVSSLTPTRSIIPSDNVPTHKLTSSPAAHSWVPWPRGARSRAAPCRAGSLPCKCIVHSTGVSVE